MSFWKKVKLVLALLLAPVLGYVLINFYWWLFDGNVLNLDKMTTSGFILGIGIFILFFPEEL